MPLALVIGDPGSHSGEPIISGSSRTLIAGSGAAHVGSDIAGHPLGTTWHGGPVIATCGCAGKTFIKGSAAAAANGATGSCGDTLSATTTSRTFISG